MNKFKTLAIVSLMLMTAHLATGQSMNIASKNGTTTTIDLSAIESIVFENNNLVINTADCGDNYFNVIVNGKLFFSDVVTAIDNMDAPSASITIYPNPANNSLTINKASNDVSEGYIYNMKGETMMSLNLSNQNNTVDISSLPSGLYFLLMDNQSTKFIKR
jgi:hypothetical protein